MLNLKPPRRWLGPARGHDTATQAALQQHGHVGRCHLVCTTSV